MSTRLQLSRDYPHEVATFAEALADPAFHRAKLGGGGADGVTLGTGEVAEVTAYEFDSAAGTVLVTVRQPVPAGQIPAVVMHFLSGALVLERTERWTLGEDACRGRVDVAVPLAPVSAQGTTQVVIAPGGSTLSVDVAVTASVPLVGGTVERAIIAGVRGLTGAEHERISGWLTRAEEAR